jgi:alpha-L-fucosidase
MIALIYSLSHWYLKHWLSGNTVYFWSLKEWKERTGIHWERLFLLSWSFDTSNRYSREGDQLGHEWVPGECDVSIRPGWFWHASEVPKSARTLLDIYYKSIGRNCHLLLNVPPNSSGLISAEDIQVLQEFSELRRSIFSHNLAINAPVSASSTRGGIFNSCFNPQNVLKEGIYTYWAPEENQTDWVLYLDLQQVLSFNVLRVQEPIHVGQRVIVFHLEILNEDGQWEKVINGTTVGYQRLLQFPTIKSQYLRFVVDKSRADPLISYFGIYMDQFSILSSNISDTSSRTYFNGTQVLQQTGYNHSQIVSL